MYYITIGCKLYNNNITKSIPLNLINNGKKILRYAKILTTHKKNAYYYAPAQNINKRDSAISIKMLNLEFPKIKRCYIL